MRILVAHNRYQHRGGEDTVVEAEIELLRSNGHDVGVLMASNEGVSPTFPAAWNAVWSRKTYKLLESAVDRFQPQILHVHNTSSVLSPSIYWAAHSRGIPVVQTLHNFRLLCLNALFLREGAPCEDCKSRTPWRGVVRRCYKSSLPASLAMAGTVIAHRVLKTYKRKVTRYIVLNEFCRTKFVEGGLPPQLIAVKPHFVVAPDLRSVARVANKFLFVGRLSVEKGLLTLLTAAGLNPSAQFVIVGADALPNNFPHFENVRFIGQLDRQSVFEEMASSAAVVVPSISYETFGLVAAEAFAMGTPVIASQIGALPNLVEAGVTGLLVRPGDPEDLARAIRWAVENTASMRQMGSAAREKFERELTPETNYAQLIRIYEEVLSARSFPDN